MATFEEALPGLQAQGYTNVMDALGAYNAANQAAYFGTPNTYAAPVASAPTTSFSATYADQLGSGKEAKLDKFADIIASGGTLSKQQEAKLGKISGIVGEDLASKLGYTPTTERYETKYAQASDYGLPSVLPSSVSELYQTVLGRDPTKTGDQAGYDYWAQKFGPTIQPWEYEEFSKAAAPELVGKAYQTVLGRDITSPEDYWVQQLQSKAMTPEELNRSIAYGASSLADQLAAQQYLGQNIFGSPEQLRSQYQTSFGQTLQDVFGTSDVSQLASSIGTTPEKLTYLSPTQYESSSLDDIRKTLQQSDANRYQEANQLFKLLPTVFGADQKEAFNIARGLYTGEAEDSPYKSIYDELLTKGLTPEVQNKILSEAAVKAPDSPYFKANPDKLAIYTPIPEIKEAPREPGQYGYYNNAPILSAKEADKLLGGEVIKGGNNYFGYGGEGKKDDALGWDLRSKYAGAIVNGAGIFGVQATNKDITDFDKIEKEIQKLGGIKTETDAEGNVRQFVYKDVVDPESGQKIKQPVDISTLFGVPNDELGTVGYERFKTYEQTKEALAKGAEQLGLNPSNFGSVKSLFDAVNDKTKDKYVVTGRANAWDPTVAEAQGITGVGRDRGGINHAQVLYQKVGDKLMPVQTLKTFNFDDPNTTSGVIGDIATGIGSILSVPPIAIALAAATGGISGLAAPLTTPVTAALVEAGLPQILASSLTNSLTSSAISALTGGDWQKNLGASLVSNLIGGASGFTQDPNTGAYKQTFTPGYGEGLLDLVGYSGSDIANLISPEKLAKLGGIYAGSQISGLDPRKVLVNQLISQGIRSLPKSSTTQSGFDDDFVSKEESGFVLNPYQKDELEQEYKKLMAEGVVETPGITGLSLAKEDWMIDALKEVVPVLMSKGLNKADATLLASNLIGAASKG